MEFTDQQKREARELFSILHPEKRDELLGTVAASSLGGNLGSFVPMQFFKEYLPRAMGTISPLFKREFVTFIQTTHGNPLQLPYLDDVQNVASVIAESTQDTTETDIFKPSQAILQAFAYRTPLFRASWEAWQDLEESFPLIELYKMITAQRLALGVGKDLLLGNGVNKPLGLLQSLLNLPTPPVVVASGSSANTGGLETGTNSIGSGDLARLFLKVPAVYKESEQTGWIMNDSTLEYLLSLVARSGSPILSVDLSSDPPKLYRKTVLIDSNMPAIASNAYTIIFGDLTYWMTRQIIDRTSYVKLYKDAPGLVEKGMFGLRTFARFDGTLMFNGTLSPLAVLRQAP